MAAPISPNVTPGSEDKNRRSAKIMIGVIIGMFIFGFASIPLYRIVCDTIDPGGSAYSNGSQDAYQGVTVDASRTVRVRMTANVNRQLPWEFWPEMGRVEVHPGQKQRVVFKAKNNDSLGSITGKAVYDINPPEAGQYFKKIECFCFQEQELAAGEQASLPLIFWFDPSMPDSITDVTIAYTFFNMDSSLERTIKDRERGKKPKTL